MSAFDQTVDNFNAKVSEEMGTISDANNKMHEGVETYIKARQDELNKLAAALVTPDMKQAKIDMQTAELENFLSEWFKNQDINVYWGYDKANLIEKVQKSAQMLNNMQFNGVSDDVCNAFAQKIYTFINKLEYERSSSSPKKADIMKQVCDLLNWSPEQAKVTTGIPLPQQLPG